MGWSTCTDGSFQQTFYKQVNWETFFPSFINDLAGVFSCMWQLHSVQHQSGNVIFQRNVAATPVGHFFGSSEPFDFQRGAAPHFGRERHVVAGECFLSFWGLRKRWRFWFQKEKMSDASETSNNHSLQWEEAALTCHVHRGAGLTGSCSICSFAHVFSTI